MLNRDPGNGFLMRQGYTMVWVGWQADIPPARPGAGLRLEAPVVAGRHRPLARGIPVRQHDQPGHRAADLPGGEPSEGATLTVRAPGR